MFPLSHPALLFATIKLAQGNIFWNILNNLLFKQRLALRAAPLASDQTSAPTPSEFHAPSLSPELNWINQPRKIGPSAYCPAKY
jgi:hypothetical protein